MNDIKAIPYLTRYGDEEIVTWYMEHTRKVWYSNINMNVDKPMDATKEVTLCTSIIFMRVLKVGWSFFKCEFRIVRQHVELIKPTEGPTKVRTVFVDG